MVQWQMFSLAVIRVLNAMGQGGNVLNTASIGDNWSVNFFTLKR